ncbi:MAG: glutaminyl-peptide cyclotransferase [Candidatus Methanofastidiosia archaeon]|jgi:glutamine cyclotransferase
MKRIYMLVIIGGLVIISGIVYFSPQPPTYYTYKVINEYPHDPDAFTQGLVYENGVLYEGTGLLNHSSLRKIDVKTGNILKIYELPDKYFGEGITLYKNKIFQITWKSGTAFVYDKDTFEVLTQFTYPTQGWGITHDGKKLIMSDGTSYIRFRNFETFEEIGKIRVLDNGTPVSQLNELEYINGRIYANVWQTDYIVIIDPDTGKVTGWINLKGLLPQKERTIQTDVLNGIAYHPLTDHLFVTGKKWPKLYEIQLIPSEPVDAQRFFLVSCVYTILFGITIFIAAQKSLHSFS